MKTENTIRVLLLANEFNSAQILLEVNRARSKGATTGIEIVEARSRDDFFREIEHSAPDVVVVESKGAEGLPLNQILEFANEIPDRFPVVVLGEDGEDGRDAIWCIEEGAADYIPVSHASRLPLVLERLRRDGARLERERKLSANLQ